MNVLDVLAYGTSLGLGSPQQQRDNVFRQSELDQRKMLAQSELETRKAAQEAEAKRFDAQYGNASPDELAFLRPQIEEMGGNFSAGAAISRPMLQHLLTAAQAMSLREPNMIVDPTNFNILGETTGRKAPMLPGVQGQYEAPNPDVSAGENPEPSGMQTRAPQDARQALVMRPGSVASMLNRRREQETETRNAEKDTRTAGLAAEKLKQIQAAREEYQRKIPIEQTLAKYPQVTAKDVYGYEPASPSTASRENTDQAYARLKTQDPETLTQPEQNFIAQHEKEKLHAGKTPDPTGDKIKAMRLQIMEEKEKARKAAEVAGNTFDRVLAGEQVSVKEREVAIKELEKSNGLLLREIDLAPPEETAGLQRERAENRKRITYLRDYVEPKTRGNTPVGPVQTLKEVPTPSFNPKDLAAARDTTVRDLFGTSARWGALSTTQKRQVLDKLNAATEE